jgi:hypothetical protein
VFVYHRYEPIGDMRPNPFTVRLTPALQAWLDSQTRDGLLSRNAIVRLALQAAKDRGDNLAGQPKATDRAGS